MFSRKVRVLKNCNFPNFETRLILVTWRLNSTFAGDKFFDNFLFYHGGDGSHGTIQYVDEDTARALNLIGIEDGKVSTTELGWHTREQISRLGFVSG